MAAFSPPDALLLGAAQAGDGVALGALLSLHAEQMYAVAASVLGPGPDAEDAVQEAALAALRNIRALRDPSALGAWLRTVVRNACLMQLRRTKAVTTIDDPSAVAAPSTDPTPEEVLETAYERQEVREQIRWAVQQLPEPMRRVVIQRYFTEASSYKEIAAYCDVPVGTVRSRLNQAKRILAQHLEEERRIPERPLPPRRRVTHARRSAVPCSDAA